MVRSPGMHRTAMLKLETFRDLYMTGQTGKVLEVGAASYAGDAVFRDLVPPTWVYTGLDVAPGLNVDLVPVHPYLWRELSDEAFDLCVTLQTFEHNPLFWVSLAEMARVTKPGGLLLVVAPGRGVVHRYPYDCWRFFPDAWAALASYVGLELLETHFEEARLDRVTPGAEWSDSSALYRRPLTTPSFLEQLARIRKTAEGIAGLEIPAPTGGQLFSKYEDSSPRSPMYVAYRRLRKLANVRAVARKLFVQP
jgi:SAM-dependent methyltransferase